MCKVWRCGMQVDIIGSLVRYRRTFGSPHSLRITKQNQNINLSAKSRPRSATQNKPITMAEIFMPLYECFAFIAFIATVVAISYTFVGILYIFFAHKSEIVRCLWYSMTGTKTVKRNGRTMPIRNKIAA